MTDNLNEAPLHVKGGVNFSKDKSLVGEVVDSSFIENLGLKTLYSVSKGGVNYNYMLSYNNSGAVAFIFDKLGENKYHVLGQSLFQNVYDTPAGKGYSSTMVDILPKYRNEGLAKNLYFYIVERGGLTILSSWQQYDGGFYLWKGIARATRDRGTSKVKIFDSKNKKFLTVNGYSYYDGFNIPDNELWASSMESSKSEKLKVSKVDILLALVKS